MFPTPDQLGVDLVLPDFSYLRDRAADIEAIVLTHGHEDHVGALPFVLREIGDVAIPDIYGGGLTVAMVRSKLDEHKLKDMPLHEVAPGRSARARAVHDGAREARALDPRHVRHRARLRAWHDVLHRDYKFDQTPVDGVPADVARLAELGREDVLLLCGDSTNADRPGMAPSESSVGPHLVEVFQRITGGS